MHLNLILRQLGVDCETSCLMACLQVGQDCRLLPVRHGDTTHRRTCPRDKSSLLLVQDLCLLNYTRNLSLTFSSLCQGMGRIRD